MAQSAQPTSQQIASDRASPFARWLDRVAFVVGSMGLLGAMSADALAVLGRHVGLPLLGSIEIVQACVVLVASAAMIGATLRKCARKCPYSGCPTRMLRANARVAMSDAIGALVSS